LHRVLSQDMTLQNFSIINRLHIKKFKIDPNHKIYLQIIDIQSDEKVSAHLPILALKWPFLKGQKST